MLEHARTSVVQSVTGKIKFYNRNPQYVHQ